MDTTEALATIQANADVVTYTADEHDRSRQHMIEQGYLAHDPKAHAKLAAFLLHYADHRASRGLLLSGRVGTGKTCFVRRFIRCRIVTASRLVEIYKENKESFRDLLEPPVYDELPSGYWDLTIDDLGVEPTANDYGTKLEVLADALSTRYRVFSRHGGKTFVTTNLSMADIKNRYGSRIESRLCEMCTLVKFTGKDQRKRSEF
jgi:DNA replication protein DnaC